MVSAILDRRLPPFSLTTFISKIVSSGSNIYKSQVAPRLEKTIKYKWSEDVDRTFQSLKTLTSEVILGYDLLGKPFILVTHQRYHFIGAVMSEA